MGRILKIEIDYDRHPDWCDFLVSSYSEEDGVAIEWDERADSWAYEIQEEELDWISANEIVRLLVADLGYPLQQAGRVPTVLRRLVRESPEAAARVPHIPGPSYGEWKWSRSALVDYYTPQRVHQIMADKEVPHIGVGTVGAINELMKRLKRLQTATQ